MNYYVSEIQTDEGVQKTAGIKARDDAEAILKEQGLKKLPVVSMVEHRKSGGMLQRIRVHAKVRNTWKTCVKELKSGDLLVVQFPIIEHSIFLTGIFKKLQKKGVRIVLLIHDLELLRVAKRRDIGWKAKLRLNMEEKSALFSAYKIIAHNKAMCDYLQALGIQKQKLVSLEIFDYLIGDYDESRIAERKNEKDMPVIVAGTLRPHKAQYVYRLPEHQTFNLYGVGYEGKTEGNICYYGSFFPDELPYVLEGSFGLVWDGECADTCSGVYGEYLKINNPHKTSLYLSTGIPVIIWAEAALAKYVEEHKCGLAVHSLLEIPQILSGMSQDQYNELCIGAQRVGEKLRRGYYMKHAIKQCIGE